MDEFDPGPPPAIAALFAALPSYAPHRNLFWYDWGTVLYRGRLDGSARLLCVASDPGPTERVAHRTLVGDAGQRVQGFLAKLGLTRSYLCLNAFAYALFPSQGWRARALLREPEHLAWRNQLFDAVAGPGLQAVVAFGAHAQRAVDLWPGAAARAAVKLPHPSSRDPKVLLNRWRDGLAELRAVVAPDPDGDPAPPTYGATFTEADYAPIPRGDLPYGVPAWLGDDSWVRRERPTRPTSVSRPSPDDQHTLIWTAPRSNHE
jgi:hypothetical protein